MTIIQDFIREQPRVLEAVAASVPDQIARLRPIDRDRPLYLVGSGTSLNALLAAAGLFPNACARVRGPLAFLTELERGAEPRGSVVVLSQTGTSTTTVQALERARDASLRTLTVTAEPDSPIGRASGDLLAMPVGPEPVGPKTKGYTASVLTLILLADRAATAAAELPALLAPLPAFVESAATAMAALVPVLATADVVQIMGQGRHLATALEGSLKLSEMAGIAAAAFDTEEALHGRFHGLGPRSLALFIAGEPRESQMAAHAAAVLEELGVLSRIFDLTGAAGPHVLPLPWPSARSALDLISAIVPFQWLACALADARGLRPERMRYPDLSQRLQIKLPRHDGRARH